jgi:hypothetical protein
MLQIPEDLREIVGDGLLGIRKPRGSGYSLTDKLNLVLTNSFSISSPVQSKII